MKEGRKEGRKEIRKEAGSKEEWKKRRNKNNLFEYSPLPPLGTHDNNACHSPLLYMQNVSNLLHPGRHN